MAMTATISLSNSTVLTNMPTQALLTISNSGTAVVNVLSIQPFSNVTGNTAANAVGCALGVPNVGPGSVVAVPCGGGSITFSFGAVFFSPSTGPIGAGVGTFDVSALCSTSDGSNFTPTAATVTVNPIAKGYPSTEQ